MFYTIYQILKHLHSLAAILGYISINHTGFPTSLQYISLTTLPLNLNDRCIITTKIYVLLLVIMANHNEPTHPLNVFEAWSRGNTPGRGGYSMLL